MNRKIEQALSRAIRGFCGHAAIDPGMLAAQVTAAFESELPFMDKVGLLDAVFDGEPRADALRELFFDLLLVNFFTGDVKKLEDDYLESPEWDAIEEQTLDRGTELLNVLLYLNECEDEGLEPGLEDYLREFLLVDEDEFQDEHRIYEDIIANQALTDSSYEEIAKAAVKLPGDAEIKELFYPVMSFFYEPDPSQDQIESYIRCSVQPGFDQAVYAILITFNQ